MALMGVNLNPFGTVCSRERVAGRLVLIEAAPFHMDILLGAVAAVVKSVAALVSAASIPIIVIVVAQEITAVHVSLKHNIDGERPMNLIANPTIAITAAAVLIVNDVMSATLRIICQVQFAKCPV